MFRWILGGLFVAVLAFGWLVGPSSVEAQAPARPYSDGIPTALCQQTAVGRCDADCGDDGPCKFGCQIGGINNMGTCESSCSGLGAPCLNSCLQVVDEITLCAFPTIGGVVSGLGAGRSVVLQNNGGDDLTVSADGAFTFPMWITLDDAYMVTVSGQPEGQTCVVANGSGLADTPAVVVTPYGVTSVAVSCTSTVPTLSNWGMVLLAGILAICGLFLLRPMFARAASPEA